MIHVTGIWGVRGIDLLKHKQGTVAKWQDEEIASSNVSHAACRGWI